MSLPIGRRARALAAPAALLLLFASACSDRGIAGPTASSFSPVPLPASAVSALTCSADVHAGSVRCVPAGASSAGGARMQVVGGQHANLELTSSNVAYTSTDSTFAFDVTVQNLLPEKLGTPDGVTADADGIRVFFASGPTATSGTGAVSVFNEDDESIFTGTAQPYFEYDTVLATGQTSAPRRWQLKVAPTVGTFSFSLYVATSVQPLLVIDEMMANPGGTVQDSVGEYVEVYNAGSFPVNLRGMMLNDNTPATVVTDTVNADVVVPAGGYRLLGRSTNTAKNGGLAIDYNYAHAIGSTSTALTLSNSGADFFRIRAASGVTIDSAGYTAASTAAKAGVARELANPQLDNAKVDGSNWGYATVNYESANKGTPGTTNSTSTTLPPPGNPAVVTLLPDSVQLAPGGTTQMSASAKDSLGQATSTTFTWTTLNGSVATVSSSGLVTAVAAGQTGIVATATNAKADTAFVQVEAVQYLNHVEFGTPTDGNPNDEIILTKPQYVTSYSPAHGGPNWVSWDLNATQFGNAPRCDCFTPDSTLPDTVYHVATSDYTGSGYSRGHMVMSQERTATEADNTQTFLMTNVLPQIQDLNGGPWEQLEIYTNELAQDSAKELYIIAGGTYSGSPGTLNGAGKVTIPGTTWKIVVIMNRGQGLADVHSASDIRVIAVNMPNQSGVQNVDWHTYKTTVDAIEAATGYDFLAALPDDVEAAVESTVGS